MRNPNPLRRLGGIALVGALMAGPLLAGCGVTGSDPTDIGAAYAPSPPPAVGSAPQPDATTPEDLVADYLDAAVGGGDSGIKQVTAFFTNRYKNIWRPPADKNSITVIRVMNQLNHGNPRGEQGTPLDV